MGEFNLPLLIDSALNYDANQKVNDRKVGWIL